MQRISEFRHPAIKELLNNSVNPAEITTANVFQTANMSNRALVNQIIAPFLQPASCYQGIEHLVELAERAKKGESCLILMEHYSNFDLPNFFHLCEHHSHHARAAVNQVIAMAGAKLNQESLFVRAFTEAYSRIVIIPARSLDSLRGDPEANKEAIRQLRTLNMASLHEMVRRKHEGHMVLVFPAGTRYRPGDESTRKGIKEMDSYIKSFDHLLFVAIAGNTLRINPEPASMSDDLVCEDTVVFYSEGIVGAQAFRDQLRTAAAPEADPKQVVADGVMAELARLHAQAAGLRTRLGGQD